MSQIPVSRWILGPTATYNSRSALFENRSKLEDLPIQSPIPLGKSFQYFTVTQEEVSPTDGKGASVGLTTFSVSSHLIFHPHKTVVSPLRLAVKTNADVSVDERLLHLVGEDEK